MSIRVHTYEIVSSEADAKLEKEFGGDHQGACRKLDGTMNKADFKITKASGGSYIDCLKQCFADAKCTAVGTYFPTGNWKNARDCALHMVDGYEPSGLAKHKNENCFVKGGSGQVDEGPPVIVASQRYCTGGKHIIKTCKTLDCCLQHIKENAPSAKHFSFKE